jgi:CubicO group peptidase (beta-lactamase class C family)
MPTTQIHGRCDARFRALRDAFAENFATRNEIGAALAVVVDGETVVDLHAGFADAERTRPWREDTIANVFSTTKGVAATCALRLVDSGELDLEAPVAKYWPEFAAAGKEAVTVRMIFNHRAGVPAVREDLPPAALFDHEAMADAFGAEKPWWTPGAAHGYHALSIGWLLGRLIRRIRGKSLRDFLRDEITGPLGLDLHVGLAEADHARAADLTPIPPEPAPGEPSLATLILSDRASIHSRAFANPPKTLAPGTVNTPEWRSAEIPGANGHATALALARLYGALARGGEIDGVRVLSRETIDRARREESFGTDLVLTVPTRFGLGFMLPHPAFPFAANDRAFGHPGAGGSLAFADPERHVGFAYVMNRTGPHILMDPRPRALVGALDAALA